MDKKISLSTGRLQRIYGDKEVLTIAKRVGCDAIDWHDVLDALDEVKYSGNYNSSPSDLPSIGL